MFTVVYVCAGTQFPLNVPTQILKAVAAVLVAVCDIRFQTWLSPVIDLWCEISFPRELQLC